MNKPDCLIDSRTRVLCEKLLRKVRRPLFQILTLAFIWILFAVSICAAASDKDPFVLLDAAEFKAVLDNPEGKVVLIDARPAERYLDGHLKGAVNLFAPDLEKTPSLLKASKEDRILVYCDGVKCNKVTGKTPTGLPCRSIEAILPTKSGKAAMAVVKQGYGNVSVLYEGFPGWDLKGFEAYAGKDDSMRMEMAVITPQDLKAVCEAKTGGDKIIDLRLPSEYARGHIVGAVNMPFAAFLVNAGSLDKSQRIIVYSDHLVEKLSSVVSDLVRWKCGHLKLMVLLTHSKNF